jgi:ATP-dependent DNA helicase UvrD/PcrA
MASLVLNPEQRAAVEHGEGPLLIIAGPGSGKTRVITQRAVHLLQTVPELQPENILALTFTDKAAGEMKSRVREVLPDLESLPHVSTFHSFSKQVLDTRHSGRPLLDKVDVWIFLRRRMKQLELKHYRKLAEPGAFLHALNEFFSRCQDELIEPSDFAAYVAQVEVRQARHQSSLSPAERWLEQEDLERLQELAQVFRKSRELMEGAGYSSLGSLISETVRLFDAEPELLQAYRARYRYILVDEFQDTNFAQVELLRRLVAPPFNITAVGDDDQAIYRFRGASHGAFEMFDQTFPGHATIFLNQNYRSLRPILRVADAVIRQNPDRYTAKPALLPARAEGRPVLVVGYPDFLSEAVWVAEEVERLIRAGASPCDLAVLYRGHLHRELLVEELRRKNIPFAIRGLSILASGVLRDLVSYLKVINDYGDNICLTRLLLIPRWNFSEDLAMQLRAEAARLHHSLSDVLQSWSVSERRVEVAATGWAELHSILASLRKLGSQSPVTSIFDRLTELLQLPAALTLTEARYVEAFRKFLSAWEVKSETGRLKEFIEYFDYFQEAGGKIEAPEPESAGRAVGMMTVHAAKGLEFTTVFVIGVAPSRFPSNDRKPVIEFPDELRKAPAPPADIHLQEERRLFFVALTRAEDCLYVCCKAGKRQSRFAKDLTSPPVVANRDIVTVSVEPADPAQHLPRRPAPPLPPREDAHGAEQPELFPQAPRASAVHPDIFDWAERPPSPPVDGKLRLSASAIEAYRTCPLKFKFAHYLKIPTGPQAALTFGSLMHQAVRKYFELRRAGTVAFAAIESFYLEKWRDLGFEDKYQEEAYQQSGREQLRAFVEKQNGETWDAARVQMEQGFSIDLSEGVMLEGRIDQITPLDGDKAELVDYKTGRPKTQKDADESLQLSVYACAARQGLRLNPVKVTFYSLQNNQAVSSIRTPQELEKTLVEIRTAAQDIRRMKFPARPGFVCNFCDYKMICPEHEGT